MTPERVKDLIATYGAASQRWPMEERSAALAMLERAPELRVEVERMAALDAMLDRWSGPILHLDAATLAAHVTASPQRRTSTGKVRRFHWPSMAWPNAAGLAAAALSGFLVGWSGLDSNLTSDAQAESTDQQVIASVIEDATW